MILWAPVAVYMIAIYVGAALKQAPGPAASLSDTVLHTAAYAGLAILTLRATSGAKRSGMTRGAIVLAFAIAMIHGISVEVEQMFLPWRMAEWRDVGNDMIGVLAGLSVAWAWGKLLKQ